MKNVFVFLADGFEDVEAVTPIDYLRRAGVDVTVVGVTGRTVTSSHQLSMVCDLPLSELRAGSLPDLAVLPGGSGGSRNLAASTPLRSFITRMNDEKRLIGAICAAPSVVLGAWDLLAGRNWTCYPGTEGKLKPVPSENRVVVDGNLVTSRSSGTAEEFSLVLVGLLCGAAAAKTVAEAIIAR